MSTSSCWCRRIDWVEGKLVFGMSSIDKLQVVGSCPRELNKIIAILTSFNDSIVQCITARFVLPSALCDAIITRLHFNWRSLFMDDGELSMEFHSNSGSTQKLLQIAGIIRDCVSHALTSLIPARAPYFACTLSRSGSVFTCTDGVAGGGAGEGEQV